MRKRRIVSFLLAFVILISGLPMSEIAYATGDRVINTITVTKQHIGLDESHYSIDVMGRNLEGLTVGVRVAAGPNEPPIQIFNPIDSTSNLVQYENIPASVITTQIIVDGQPVDLASSLPKVSSKDPENGFVDIKDGEITIKGSGFSTIREKEEANTPPLTRDNVAYLERGTDLIDLGKDTSEISDNKIKGDYLKNSGAGNVSLVFRAVGRVQLTNSPEVNKDFEDPEKGGTTIITRHRYPEIFQATSELNVGDPVEMSPTRGILDTKVSLKSNKLLSESQMSIFLVKDLSDGLTLDHMVDNPKLVAPAREEFTFNVPKSLENIYGKQTQGAYYVVLTNYIDPKDGDPEKGIIRRKILKQRFLVVDATDSMQLIVVEPKSGSAAGGEKADILGKNVLSMSRNSHVPKGDHEEDLKNGKLTIKYKGGEYIPLGPVEGEQTDRIEYETLEREVTAILGTETQFQIGDRPDPDPSDPPGTEKPRENIHQVSVDGSDITRIKTPQITDLTDPTKDLTVIVKTKMIYRDKPGEPVDANNKEHELIFEEEAYLENAYTFLATDYQPEVTEIIPSLIPVDAAGTLDPQGIQLTITGENFVVHRYEENGKTKFKYPSINIADEIHINKNFIEGRDYYDKENNPTGEFIHPDDIELEVYDKNGDKLTGREGNNRGNKIVLTIPDLPKEAEINMNKIDIPQDVIIRNPTLNSGPIEEGPGGPWDLTNMGPSAKGEVTFVQVDADQIPVIDEIIPEISPIEGYEDAKVLGSNFGRDIKVYLDGEEITEVERNDIGTELTFDLPPRPEGKYTIMIQNEEGGIALAKVNYVKAYTTISIDDFNPKRGSKGTIVTVTGSGFLRPINTKISNPQGVEARKLIGTTVLLGGKDINEYNTNSEGYIELKDFDTGSYDEDVLYLYPTDLGYEVKGAEYYQSVILEEEGTGDNYSIYYDIRDGKYKISDSSKSYELSVSDNKMYASYRGSEYGVKINNTHIILEKSGVEKRFRIRTPYKTSGGEITGNKVKVINDKELIFEVPYKPREGFYDVTVENPDVMRDSKVGDDGFYYFYQPTTRPEIDKIYPSEGSVDGGYYIDITAKKNNGERGKFVDRGQGYKTTVVIGTQVVPEEDVEVSADGYTLTVKVPKYPGDLENEIEIDRKTVPVTVVNPDGGSDSKEDGFTYVIAKSNPYISNIYLEKGTAAGGDIVMIEGSDFRFYEPYIDKNQNGQYDEDEPFTDLNNNRDIVNDKVVWDDLGEQEVYISQDKDGMDVGVVMTLDEIRNDEMNGDFYWDTYVKPILPKVYFGGRQAEVVDFEMGRLEVKSPKGLDGAVKVYIVNNDYGRSNEVDFNYEASNPSITSIAPKEGANKGGQPINILGENFVESDVDIINSPTTSQKTTMQLVRFGDADEAGNPTDDNMTNAMVKPGDVSPGGFDNSGKIEYREANVKVGDLKVRYNAKDSANPKLEFEMERGSGKELKKYKFTFNGYNEEAVYLPLKQMKQVDNRGAAVLDDEGNEIYYDGIELVKVSLERIEGLHQTRRLRVDRGFSPNVKTVRTGLLDIELPTYYTVRDVKATVINPDDEKANADFGYRNPASNPIITNILNNGQSGNDAGEGRTVVPIPHPGGSRVTIEGADFRKPVTLTIGGTIQIPAEDLEYYPQDRDVANKIEFTMPAVDAKYVKSGPLNVSLTNRDGGSTLSDPIYVEFTSPETMDLEVTAVVPDSGPTKGGTTVTIHGNDFRETMSGYPNKKLKVFFERGAERVEIPQGNIQSVDLDKIVLVTPPFTAGPVDVIIENPDGNTVRLLGGFTYTSDPIITSVVDPDYDAVINNISAEGGERIKIVGNDFVDTPRVIFNPKLEEITDPEQATGDVVNIGGKAYNLVSGNEGTDVEYLNRQSLLVTTPPGQVGDKGVLVINPDGGASNVYDLEYGIPEVGAPFNVRAEVIYDEFIRVNWQGVRNALEYEVYVSIDGKGFEYIGSTELMSFIYRDIKPRTDYQFLVRALGEYGSSEPIDESKSNTVTTGRTAGPGDEDGGLGEDTTVDRQGENVDVILGERDYDRLGLKIDLTRGELAGATSVTIRIPARVVTNPVAGDVTILAKDYTMKFNPSAFASATMYDNRNNPKAGVVFKMAPHVGNTGGSNRRMVAGAQYMLEASTYMDKAITPMDALGGFMNLTMDSNPMLVNSRRLTGLHLSRFNDVTRAWDVTPAVNRMGIYAITGNRR